MRDGEEKTVIEMPLPEVPLSNDEEIIQIVLDDPTGAPAKLSEDRSCSVQIRHDKGNKHGLVVEKTILNL